MINHVLLRIAVLLHAQVISAHTLLLLFHCMPQQGLLQELISAGGPFVVITYYLQGQGFSLALPPRDINLFGVFFCP